MDNNDMRNIVILKNLPSNLIEEAFVVLKKNQKIKKYEYVENFSNDSFENKNRENEDEYIVKEAELVISNYINNLENQDIKGFKMNSYLAKKYKKLKKIACVLSAFLLISFAYIVLF